MNQIFNTWVIFYLKIRLSLLKFFRDCSFKEIFYPQSLTGKFKLKNLLLLILLYFCQNVKCVLKCRITHIFSASAMQHNLWKWTQLTTPLDESIYAKVTTKLLKHHLGGWSPLKFIFTVFYVSAIKGTQL